MKKERRINIFRAWSLVISLLFVALFPLGTVDTVRGADTAAYTVKVAGNKLGMYSGKKNLSGKKASVSYGTSAGFVSGSKKLSGITYKSSDKKSLSVSRKGIISVKKAGIGRTVKVTVTAKYNQKKIKTTIRFQIKKKQQEAPSSGQSEGSASENTGAAADATDATSSAADTETTDAVSGATQEAAADGQQGSTEETYTSGETGNGTVQDTPSGTAETTENADKVLVVYFSHTGENYSVGRIEKGNTAILAGQISDRLQADRFEILAGDPYPESYEECNSCS